MPLRDVENCIFSVAYKILNRSQRPAPAEALACALLAAADISGVPVGSFRSWRADRDSIALRKAELLLKKLLDHLCALYGIREEDGPEIPLPLRRMKDAVKRYRPTWVQAAPLSRADSSNLQYFLTLLFGKPAFRPGQREAVIRLLKGEDAFLVLPTGGGKSLAYQLAAMLLPGTCLVVEPTLSLIEDQISNLAQAKIARVLAIAGEPQEESRATALCGLIRGEADFCYVAPERLQTSSFRRALQELAHGPGLCLAAVDEAHCVSEWGHDFRTAYLHAGRILREKGSAPGRRLPLLAVTGTASGEVLRDVRRTLGMEEEGSLLAPLAPDRPELSFHVIRCRPAEKVRRVKELIADLPLKERRGILFCPHVEGSLGVRNQAEWLRRDLGWTVEVYHGKPPRGVSKAVWEFAKREAAQRFKEDQTDILVATKAFGLGIDKPNIRYTIHLSLPSSIEAFYQEAGRAGRDGAPASSWIIASIEDVPRALWLLDPRTSVSEIRAEVERTRLEDADDVIHALYLHTRAFRGPDCELEDIKKVLDRLGDISRPGPKVLSMPTQHQPLIEKSLHRLCSLGVASDYTVNHRVPEFQVWLTGMFPERASIEIALEKLLIFVYETVEKTRRRCLARMLEGCLPGVTDEELRQRVFGYLR